LGRPKKQNDGAISGAGQKTTGLPVGAVYFHDDILSSTVVVSLANYSSTDPGGIRRLSAYVFAINVTDRRKQLL